MRIWLCIDLVDTAVAYFQVVQKKRKGVWKNTLNIRFAVASLK